jgi:hypothetical protein
VHPCMHEYACVDMCMCLHVHLIIWLSLEWKNGKEKQKPVCRTCGLDILGGKERNK